MAKREYDSTVARIAGNILSGYINSSRLVLVPLAVQIARAIVEETKRTEPEPK